MDSPNEKILDWMMANNINPFNAVALLGIVFILISINDFKNYTSLHWREKAYLIGLCWATTVLIVLSILGFFGLFNI